MDILTALKEHGPWLAMSDLTKLTKQEAAALRAELKALMAANKVQKTGKKRGTKYALPGVEAPESQDGVDFKDKIREVMQEAKEKVSRKQLCDQIGTYDAKIRPSLLGMIDSGEICHNNKKKGQLYWLKQHEDAGIVAPHEEEEKVEVQPEYVVDESDPEITDIYELVRKGMKMLKPNVEFTISELQSHISSSGNHSFSDNQIFRAWKNLYDKGEFPALQKENRYTQCGWYIHLWVDPVIASAVE